MKIIENIFERKSKTVFKQIRKITPHLHINPFTHIPLYSLIPLFLFIIILVESCNTTEPNGKGQISLTLEDVSCAEAWIKLETENLGLPINIWLLKNNSVEQTINLSKSDTIIYIDSLSPNNAYVFQVSNVGNTVSSIQSNKITVTTIDTTSHNFTWQEFTFGGEAGSCNLNDVAIIDENNIWAVGAIYLKDSSGQPDPQPYNLARWDGKKWNLEKIPYNYQGQPFFHPIKSVFAFNSNDIWFCGNGIIRWGGARFIEVPIPSSIWGPFQMNEIWGISDNDLYIVGNGGSIAHYQNGQWSKIASGTDIRLTDIYGTQDGKNIWACGWDNDHSNSIILEIEDFTVRTIWDGKSVNGEYFNLLNSLWTNGGEFWLAGGFVFRNSILFSDVGHLVRTAGYKLFDPGNFTLKIRGTGKNDIYLAGDLGMLWHFNGVNWHKYGELYNEQFDRRFNSIAVKNNIAVAVGWKNSSAWIVIGNR